MTERLIYKNIFQADNTILTLSVVSKWAILNLGIQFFLHYNFYEFSLLYLNNSPIIVIVSCQL